MPAVKRSASSELVGRPSVHHSSVTLYTPTSSNDHSGDVQATDLPDTRSKRAKIVKKEVSDVAVSQRTRGKRVVTAVATSSSIKLEHNETEDIGLAKVPQRLQRRKVPSKPKVVKQSLDIPHPAPGRWREAYDTIKQMRASIVAPVDTMGCDQAQYQETDPKSRRFATLISLMLSSQTKDEVTDAAVKNLRVAIGGTLTIANVLQAEDSVISGAIAKVGFWRRKTQYIKQAAQKLKDDFDSDVPKTVDELCSLPGVGPKMAFLALQVAWNINVGIGVDVHVHRITNRLKWHKPATKTPEETRLNLQSWLPTELHPEINHMLVGFGQTVCLPVGPRCDTCELSNGLCPSAVSKPRSKSRSSRIQTPLAGASSATGPRIEITIENIAVKSEVESDLSSLSEPEE